MRQAANASDITDINLSGGNTESRSLQTAAPEPLFSVPAAATRRKRDDPRQTARANLNRSSSSSTRDPRSDI